MTAMHDIDDHLVGNILLGSVAGVAGGAAEVVWISLVHISGGASPVDVARAIAAVLGSRLGTASTAALLGACAHLVLSALLGSVMYVIWRRLRSGRTARVNLWVFSIATLMVVWATNFYLVLPRLDPKFLAMVPVLTGLISKLAFALVFCATIRAIEARQRAQTSPRRRVLSH